MLKRHTGLEALDRKNLAGGETADSIVTEVLAFQWRKAFLIYFDLMNKLRWTTIQRNIQLESDLRTQTSIHTARDELIHEDLKAQRRLYKVANGPKVVNREIALSILCNIGWSPSVVFSACIFTTGPVRNIDWNKIKWISSTGPIDAHTEAPMEHKTLALSLRL